MEGKQFFSTSSWCLNHFAWTSVAKYLLWSPHCATAVQFCKFLCETVELVVVLRRDGSVLYFSIAVSLVFRILHHQVVRWQSCRRPSCPPHIVKSNQLTSRSPTIHRVVRFEPKKQVYLLLLGEQLLQQLRWFLSHVMYLCSASNWSSGTSCGTPLNCPYGSVQGFY